MNTDFGIWNAEEEKTFAEGRKKRMDKIIIDGVKAWGLNFDKTNKKGDMIKYYTSEGTIEGEPAFFEVADIGWKMCKDEMPDKTGRYMVKVEIGGSIEAMTFDLSKGGIFLYYSGLQPVQWFKMPPPLEEERGQVAYWDHDKENMYQDFKKRMKEEG